MKIPPGLFFGLDALVNAGVAPLAGKRVGLVTHPAARAWDNRSSVEAFAEAGNLELAALFGPEHGWAGDAQDLEGVPGVGRDFVTGLPVTSLYGETFESLTPTPEMLRGLDVLVIDLQDVGARYYTFQATMLYCMEAAARVGLPVMVLDRTNPLDRREIEGPTIRPGFESFVGAHPIPVVHGMTIGELARLYQAERVPTLDLTVIESDRESVLGWSWERDWLPPSPNMPTLDTVAVYPGMCLIEGTNLSEGRGTTRPFEYVGFPGMNPERLADRLRAADVPGIEFVPVQFRPTFQKHAGKTCGGVFIIPRADFRPVRTGLAVLCAFRELLGDRFRWRTETYEFVSHIPAIDLLFGSDRERLAIDAGQPWREIAAAWEPEEEAFRQRREPYLLYRG
jgi:uncharacterized protein YbbC (DUF1343 family)